MLLVRPPEWILLQDLVLLEVLPDAPALIICQGEPVLLKEGVNPGDSPIPGILQVIQCESSVLCLGLFSLEGILGPHPLGVDVLTLPGLDVPVQVRNHLIFLVLHPRPKVGRASILGLLPIS